MGWKGDVGAIAVLGLGAYVAIMNADKIAAWLGSFIPHSNMTSTLTNPPAGAGTPAATPGAPNVPTIPAPGMPTWKTPPVGGYSPNAGNQPGGCIWSGSPWEQTLCQTGSSPTPNSPQAAAIWSDYLNSGGTTSPANPFYPQATVGQTPSATTSAALVNVPGNITGTASNFNPNDVTPWAQPGSPAWNAAHGLPN